MLKWKGSNCVTVSLVFGHALDGPYSEPVESNPHTPTTFKIHFNIILPFTHRSLN